MPLFEFWFDKSSDKTQICCEKKTQICCFHHKPQQKWNPLQHDGQFNITSTFFVEDDIWMACFRDESSMFRFGVNFNE